MEAQPPSDLKYLRLFVEYISGIIDLLIYFQEMPNPQLIEYIKQSRMEGNSDAEVKNILFNASWQQIDIDEAFNSLKTNDVNVSRFSKVAIILMLMAFITVGGGFVYWYFINNSDKNEFIQLQNNTSNNIKAVRLDNTVISLLDNEKKTFNILPGHKYIINSSINITGTSGTKYSVPYIDPGSGYIKNNQFDSIPINNTVVVFDHINQSMATLKKKHCNTETRFTDVPEIWVTGCLIEVENYQVEYPIIEQKSINKIIPGNDQERQFFRSNYSDSYQGAKISDLPFLYVGIPLFWVEKDPKGVITGGANSPRVSGGVDYDFSFPVITSYGLATINYTSTELFNLVEKQINIGPSVVGVKPVRDGIKNNQIYERLGVPIQWINGDNNNYSFAISMTFSDDIGNYKPVVIDFSY